MLKHLCIALIVLALALLAAIGFATRVYSGTHTAPVATSTAPTLDHAQLVYTYALEWCESRGNEGAVNPKDSDGTPSYYSWQWKPTTFLYFGVKYGVLPATTTVAAAEKVMDDYATERKVIEAMVLDRAHIEWSHQFPDCTHKIGYPPA